MTINQTEKIYKDNSGKGFTIIELLIYSAGMLIILSVIFYMIVNMYNFYRQLTIEPRVDRVGTIIVDRISKDIRSGRTVDLSQSQFNSSTGNITIESKSGSTDIVKSFNYDSGRLTYQEDSGSVNFLSPSDMSISRFYFTHLESPISEAIKIELRIDYQLGEETRSKDFNGFVILRHSYE